MLEVRKLKCIHCNQEFIPPTFHEEVLFYPYKGSYKVLNYQSHFTENKPYKVLIQMWITYCPNCGYVHRYKRKVAQIKRVYHSNPNDIESSYEEVDYEKPLSDYLDYLNSFMEYAQSKINQEFKDIPISRWIELFGYDKEQGEYKKDDFKFLIRLIASLEEYHDIHLEKENDLNMPEKIKRLGLLSELEEDLIELNNLRNKIVHKGYEMSDGEGNEIYNNYYDFIKFLLEKRIIPIIKKAQEESGYDFLRIEDIYQEVSIFLQKYFYEQFQFNRRIFNNLRKSIRELFYW